MKDFNQAQALINRLMEAHGGSADAYASPVAPTSAPTAKPTTSRMPVIPDLAAFSRLQTPDPVVNAPVPTDEDDEECIDGTIDWEGLGDRVWTSPPPIDEDRYVAHGVVEDAEELDALYQGFRNAIKTGQPQSVKLESGIYQVLRHAHHLGWELRDSSKDRLYLQETGLANLAGFVEDTDTFIWVMTASNHDDDLGYIHEGYVFLHK
jgi:hypothetical protein